MMRNRPGSLACRMAAGVVLVLTACGGEDPTGIVANGTVEVREIDVSPLAAGRVVRVLADEGQSVAAGDTLAVLTAPTLEADLSAAAARVASAEANLEDLLAGSRPQEVAAARAEVASARIEAGRVERDRERLAALLAAGAIAAREYDAAAAAAETASERVRVASERLSLLEAGSRPARISAARGELANARAVLAARRATTDEFVLLAPVAGTILSRLAEPGDLLPVGMPALVLGVMNEPWVRVYVPARALPSIAIGGRAVIHPPGAGGAVASVGEDRAGTAGGRVVAINPKAEYVTRMALTEEERADLLFGVKVAIDDPEHRFKPGMPVTVHIARSDARP